MERESSSGQITSKGDARICVPAPSVPEPATSSSGAGTNVPIAVRVPASESEGRCFRPIRSYPRRRDTAEVNAASRRHPVATTAVTGTSSSVFGFLGAGDSRIRTSVSA